MSYLLLPAGLILLVIGAEALVRGAVSIAQRLAISPLLIGLTLVGFGTSAPEFAASLHAALVGAPGIAIGNVVGSNICNILLVLGLSALVFPVATSPTAYWRDGGALAVATLAAAGALASGLLGPVAGAVLLVLLGGYLVLSYRLDARCTAEAAAQNTEVAAELPAPLGLPLSLLYIGAAFAMILIGARLLVGSAIEIATLFGVSESLIGLTLVAVGTSLPELAVSLMAAWRGHSDIAFGNVVGSNIFNLAGILGATALVAPMPVPPEILRFDLWAMLGAAAALLLFARSGWRIGRVEGAVLFAGYLAYLGLIAGTA